MTCGAELAGGGPADCWKSRGGMLAAPSGTPRSVTAHAVLTARCDSIITVAEDTTVAAEDMEEARVATLPTAG